MLRKVVTIACLCLTDAACAAPVSLSGHAISEMVVGAVVELDTPLGTKLPITYGDDGRMTGQAGALGLYLGASRDKGRWWVAADLLCQKWEKWFDAETQCLRIRKEGSRIYWASRDGKTGTGTVHLRVAATREPVRATPKPVAAKTVVVASATPHRPAISAFPSPAHLPAPSPGKVAEGTAEGALGKAVDAGNPGEIPSAAAPHPTLLAQPMLLAQHPRPLFSRLTSPYYAPVALAAPPESRTPAQIEAVVPPEAEAPATAPHVVAAPPAAAAAAEIVPLFKVVNVRSGDVLNVRAGPSEDHAIVGAIAQRGRGVAMNGACRPQWCPVRHLDVSGWVKRTFLESEDGEGVPPGSSAEVAVHDSPDAPRGCLSPAARELLGRIETAFGAIHLVSTCRSGATIAGTGRPSRHRDGNAFDFNAGGRKQAVVDWLIANHAHGGTMTYRDMDHVHVDIGPHFVALASAGRTGRDWSSERMGLSARK